MAKMGQRCGYSWQAAKYLATTFILHLLLFLRLTSSAALPSNIDVSIPPILEEGPTQGELLFRLTSDPDHVTENLTIPCRADALPLPTYTWFKDGSFFYPDGVRVHAVEGEGTLVFSNPQPDDEGDYQCSATNSAGSVFSDIVNVRRGVTISFPKGEPRVVTAVLGQPLALKCQNPGGYPVPSLHWVLQKSDGALRSVGSPRATVDDQGTLWFGSVALEDASEEALYACATSSSTSERQIFIVHDNGFVSLEESEPTEETFFSLNLQTEYRMGNWVYLNVTMPPSDGSNFTLEEHGVEPFLQYTNDGDRTLLLRENLKLFCIYGGMPVPDVRWWREDGHQIDEDNIVEFGKALHFHEIESEDEATFFCQATNQFGEGPIHTFSVNIEASPTFEEEPGTINQPLGEDAIFRCSATGEPTPTITWSINGEPMEDLHDSTLKFESLQSNDKGVIACNASNRHGYVYSTGFLNVLSLPPEFTVEPQDSLGLEGKRITLPCEGYGGPDPQMEWLKENDDGVDEKITLDDDRFDVSDTALAIKSLSDSSSGTFKCVATNKFGSVSATVTVKIIGSTEVDVHSSSELTKAGDTIDIYCYVIVDPNLEVDVTWMRDNSPIDFNDPRITSEKVENDSASLFNTDGHGPYDRVLRIKDSRGDDAGVYSCISRTEQDEAEESIIITVEDVPNAPEIIEVECSPREAYLHWASKSENGSPIIGYIIQVQTELTKDKWEEVHNDIPALKTTFRVKLYPSLSHIFRVIAVNRVGSSDPSLPSSFCVAPGTPPDYNPRNTTLEVIDSSTLQLKWNPIPPKEHNGPEFRYVVSWKRFDQSDLQSSDEDTEVTIVEGDDDIAFIEDQRDLNEWSKMVIEDWEQTEVEIDGLRAHTQYMVRVVAANDHGEAPSPEDILIYTNAGVPTASPTHLRVRRVTDTTAILFWVPVPTQEVFGSLRGYEIEIWKVGEEDKDDGMEDSEEDLIAAGQTSRADLTGLEPYTEYEARVRVLNSKFAGPYTNTIRFLTGEGEPSPVVDLKALAISSSSILIEWSAPVQPRGIITKYIIRYEPIFEDEGEDIVIVTGTAKEVIKETKDDAETVWLKLSDLDQNTLYRVNVSARNARRIGEWSTVEAKTEETESSIPVPPVFSWDIVESASSTMLPRTIVDRDNDDDIDDDDIKFQNVILADVDGDGDIDNDDVLDTDGDGDIDNDDLDIADINNDGIVNDKDIVAGDRDGDGDIDEYDIGDEDGDGDFDVQDVIIADKDGDGDIDAEDDDGENIILGDFDGDGDVDEDDATDVDGDGDIDEEDLEILDIDNDGDIDMDDVRLLDKDQDGDIDAADVIDLDHDGKLDKDDLITKDVDNDGDIDRMDFINRNTFIGDTDGDGDVDSDDILDIDGDGDIDEKDFDVADINNDGLIDKNDVEAADRDGDGDVDTKDIRDEDGDGDIDGFDVLIADEDGDGDIDSNDVDGEGILFTDRNGDGNIDEDDVTDIDGDGDVDENDFSILDVNDDGKIDEIDMNIIDKDQDGDVDSADIIDFNKDGKIDEDDLEVIDRDGDGDIDAIDISNQHVYLKDIDGDGDIDINDLLDIDKDGDVDETDKNIADIDNDGDVDADDLLAFDKDGDGDIDADDITDLNGDGKIGEEDFEVIDKDGDGDIDKQDYILRNVFLTDADGDGDIDQDDVLDNDGDGDIDEHDIDIVDINKDGEVNYKDLIAGDVDKDGDIDIADIGDEDGDGDIDDEDLIAADEDGDGDIDNQDDDGDSILLTDRDNDGDIDKDDVTDVNRDGKIDEADFSTLDIDNDGDVDEDDLKRGDRDNDGDIDAADITDQDGDGDVDGNDVLISDRDGDGDIDMYDRRNKQLILGDADGDGDVDSEDVLDTDKDGDIDAEDFAAADINNDGEITIEDVYAADQDGDGDVDESDIGDVDGDGDIDADDVMKADHDGDGDIDLADKGEGVDIIINWQPDVDNNPGSEFYIKYRPVGREWWQKSPVETKSLEQKIRGLDPYTAYEVQMVAKDGEFETASNITVINPVSQSPAEGPTLGAVMNDADPMLMTWFIVAIMAAVTMMCVVVFSIWVYHQRLSRVSELRTQLYEGYEPPTVTETKAKDTEAAVPEAELDDSLTAEKQRQQMSALLKRQETVQSVDSFASHDDDFAEYGDETMAIDLLNSVSLITGCEQEGGQQ